MKNNTWKLHIVGLVILIYSVPAAGHAACNSTAPLSNTTVTCTGADIPAVAAASDSAGVTINIAQGATGSYAANLGGEHQRTITGNAGVRWAW